MAPSEPPLEPVDLDRELKYPWGRYEGSAPGVPPTNRTIVGRGSYRSVLMDWLIAGRRSGAFLITGSRGVGKSTFVDACISDYCRDFNARIAAHPVAGHFLSKAQLLLIGVFHVLLVPWLASELAGCLAASISSTRRVPLVIVWVPFALVALRPLAVLIDDYLAFRAIRNQEGTYPPRSPERLTWTDALRPLATGLFGALLCVNSLPLSLSPELPAALCMMCGIATVAVAAEFWLARSASNKRGRTLLGRLYRIWFPVLRAKVNLGFDNLDQTTVARAMLASLVREHHRELAGLGSGVRRVSFGIIIVATLFLVTQLKPALKAAFVDPVPETPTAAATATPAPSLLDRVIPSLSREHPLEIPRSGDTTLLAWLLPHVGKKPSLDLWWLLLTTTFSLTALSTISSGHTRLNRRVLGMLRSLDSTTRHVQSGLAFKIPQVWGASLEKGAESLTIETGKLDPRQLEHRVVEVIQEMTQPTRVVLRSRFWFTASADIVFVFDELDKVGNNRLTSALESATSKEAQSSHFGGERNRDLHRLLSEMKNLVSTAAARFIFIGGRDLDDEWLADRTARRPLLSTIFDGEIYLPSLLVDGIEGSSIGKTSPGSELAVGAELGEHFFQRVIQFVKAHFESTHERSKKLHRSHAIRPHKATWWTGATDWTKHPDRRQLAKALEFFPTWTESSTPKDASLAESESVTLEKNFYRYLAFVGRGNPETLESLLDELMIINQKTRQHELCLRYADRFRVAFFGRIFQRVAPVVAYRTEDKVVQSAFYLTEFLFKFHNRAFHWSSLELLDELLDVHHAPDLREIMARIVNQWSQSYIVPIESGMYRFRFGSAFSAEIRYLSRLSSSAMATFNFTLDETYLLKQEYDRRLHLARERKEDEFTIRSALGELYDFEEDYQQARHHYFAAIQSLDQALNREYDGSVLRVLGITEPASKDAKPPVPELASQSIAAQGRAQINWSIPRLFHRLRIGLTYERTGDYVDAMIQYRNARTIANSVLADLMSEIKRRKPVGASRRLESDPPWTETTKEMQLLLEPIFACAWIAEKSRAPSSGAAMLEHGVRYALQLLDDDSHGFSLSHCDLHLKCGAFYLLRGRGWEDHAYRHYAAAALCVYEHLRSEGENQRALALGVVRRLAPALLGMADVCFALSKVAYCEPGIASKSLDQSRIAELANALAEEFADPKRQRLHPWFGTLNEQYRSRLAPSEKPTTGELPEAPFEWYIVLSDTAAHLLDKGGRFERAERVWLTTRRHLVLAAWAVRAYAKRDELQAPQQPDRHELLGKLRKISQTPFGQNAWRDKACVPNFRGRVDQAAVLACATEGTEPSALQEAKRKLAEHMQMHPYPVRGSLAIRENLLLAELLAKDCNAEQLERSVAELVRLNGEYDSPMHFTPSAFGLVVGLASIALSQQKSRKYGPATQTAQKAIAALRRGLSTVTRQEGYGRLMSTVFYLDDGFSDRELQAGHAQQMFLYELSGTLINRIEEEFGIKAPATSEEPAPSEEPATASSPERA